MTEPRSRVYGQRYDAKGLMLGAEFPISSFEYGDKLRLPVVASDALGNFVVAWMGRDGRRGTVGIFARRYSATGRSLGAPFRVNTTAMAPAIASDAQGNFVVAWQSYGEDGSGFGIYIQRFGADGLPRGSELRVNQTLTGDQLRPAIASDALGNFVVSWHSRSPGEASVDVYARRFAADGSARGGEFRVNSQLAGTQTGARISSDAAGNVVIVWTSAGGSSTTPGVYAQRYAADGTPAGLEFQVNSRTDGEDMRPAVSSDARGGFVVSWNASPRLNLYEIFVRRYDAAGSALGPEVRVNVDRQGHQKASVVASNAQGDFVVAWTSGLFESDVHARRYSGSENIDLRLLKKADRQQAAAGGALKYRLTVSNLHPGDAPTGVAAIDRAIGAAADVQVVDPLPPGMRYLGFSGEGWSCLDESQTVRCQYAGALAAGGSSSLELFASLPADFTSISNTAEVDGSRPESRRTNNSSTALVERGVDDAPDGMTFGDKFDVAADRWVTTRILTISGIAVDEVPISVERGEYRIYRDGAWLAWTDEPGTVRLNEQVQLRLRSSAQPGGARRAILSIGGSIAFLEATTVADPLPDPFMFASQSGVPSGSWIESEAITLSGFDVPLPISVSGGQFRVRQPGSSEWGNWRSFPRSVTAPVEVQVRVRSAPYRNGATTEATLAVGTRSALFSVSTFDNDPDPVVFPSALEAAVDTMIVSEPVRLTGFDGSVIVRVEKAEYRVCRNGTCGTWRSDGSQVVAGDEVQLRLLSSSELGTTRVGTFELSSVYERSTFTVKTAQSPVGPPGDRVFQVAEPGGLFDAAADKDGNTLVVWTEYDALAATLSVQARRYSAEGIPLGQRIPVSVFSTTYRRSGEPAVSAGADGDFIVVWSEGVSADGLDIFARRIGRDGAPLGAAFRVNGETAGYQATPDVASDALGNFMVSWTSEEQDGSGYRIHGQRFTADGTAAGPEIRVRATPDAEQNGPRIAMDDRGNVIVVWNAYRDGELGTRGIFAQRYAADGLALGTEFRVNDFEGNAQSLNGVACSATGDFVILWSSEWDIYARRYRQDGLPFGASFRVNSQITADQSYADVVMDAQGAFSVVWESNHKPDLDYDVYLRRYGSDGRPLGLESRMNTFTPGYQTAPVLALGAQGALLVAWYSRAYSYKQLGYYEQHGIYARLVTP